MNRSISPRTPTSASDLSGHTTRWQWSCGTTTRSEPRLHVSGASYMMHGTTPFTRISPWQIWKHGQLRAPTHSTRRNVPGWPGYSSTWRTCRPARQADQLCVSVCLLVRHPRRLRVYPRPRLLVEPARSAGIQILQDPRRMLLLPCWQLFELCHLSQLF